jgi:hypothetical protein
MFLQKFWGFTITVKTLLYFSGYQYIPKENLIVTVSHSPVSPVLVPMQSEFLKKTFCKNTVLHEYVVALHWLSQKI